MKILGIAGQARSGKDTVADRLVKEHGFVKVALADPIKRLGHQVFEFTEKQLWGPSEHRNKWDARYDYYSTVRANSFTTKKLNKLVATCNPQWLGAARNLMEHGPDWLEDVLPGTDIQSLYDWFSALGNNHARLSPRVMLQHLGTEWGREVADEDIWVNYMVRVAEKIMDGRAYDKVAGIRELEDIVHPSGGVVVSDVRFHNELKIIKASGGKIIRVHRPDTDTLSSKTGIENHASEMEQKTFDDNDFHAVLQNRGSLADLYETVDIVARTWRD